MEHVRIEAPREQKADSDPCEAREAPRFTLLIRAAKLVTRDGEFVCVIRDVSSSGVSLRGFHPLPADGPLALELQTGETHVIKPVWRRGNEAGFRFVTEVEVHDLVAQAGRFPKRRVRLNLAFPVTLVAGGQRVRAELTNLSQQGARLDCAALFAIEQPLRIVSDRLPEIVARVRWRRADGYGVVFDDTFTLEQIALLVASMQRPDLLAEPASPAAQRHG